MVILIRKLKASHQRTNGKKGGGHDASAKGISAQARGSRKWTFRIIALLLPLILLLSLETALRLANYGYSPDFFLAANVGGQEVFVENQKFSQRYFPPALARTPQPVMFAAKKPPGTTRIFIFGESAAMGDPEPAFGFPRVLDVLLHAQYPGKRFEIINVAVTAINSHAIREIARDCASKDGDFWIIYMGNNEVVGPYGAGTVFGSQAPSLGFIRASIALKGTRIGQLIEAARTRFLGQALPAAWEGMEMFLKQQVRRSDPRMNTVYSHFERNLDDIARIGEKAGARVILSTVVSNLKDCPPFASLHRSRLSAEQKAEWENLYLGGIEFESKTNLVEALARYRECERIDDEFAELQFRIGRSLLASGKAAEAAKHFSSARDLDTLRFRADTRLNQIIRNFAQRDEKLAFFDAAEFFSQQSRAKIAGDEFLIEHVHFNFEGNCLLARGIAQTVTNLVAGASHAPWLSERDCAERLALTDWDRLQIIEEVSGRLAQAPFTQQLDHESRAQHWQRQREQFQSATQGHLINAQIDVYRRALALRPADSVLRENFAKLLQSTGDPNGAEQEWRKVLELLPHSEQALYSLGNVLDAQGKSAEALSYFKRALSKRPASFEARNGLGLALSSQGRTEEAIEHYRAALLNKPNFTEARINLGQALAQLGRDDEAIAEYHRAIQTDSNSAGARINLGKALAKKNLATEARAEYEAALRLNPNDPVAHYNLGNLLSGQKDDEAAKHFEEAARGNPQFAEARYNLGLAYAAANRTSDAITQFAEVVRLRPGFVAAHLNLGVALARQHRYAEAIAQFEETLRLEPGNSEAKRFLDQAKSLRTPR